MILSATFVIPDSHFGIYFAILDRFYERNGNKMTSFCKGTFQGLSLAGQMYHKNHEVCKCIIKNTKFGTKLSDGPLSQKYIYIYICIYIHAFIYISLFDNHCTHRLQNLKCKGRLPPVLCFFTISNKEHRSWWSMSHNANNMVCNFIEICAKLPMCNGIPCDSPDYSVADTLWFFLYSWYMVVEWHLSV